MFQRLISDLARKVGLGDTLNDLATSQFTNATTPRPRAYSLWCHTPSQSQPGDEARKLAEVGEYTAWPSLVDRQFSGRHLPPMPLEEVEALPSLDKVLDLFKRTGKMRKSRSSALFCFFAQWFTDSILRTDPYDRRKNTSNHDIDLCQIYGLDEETTRILRSHSEGKLRCQEINGEIYPDYLFELDANAVLKEKDIYKDLPHLPLLKQLLSKVPLERQLKTYATGLERGNSSIGYVAISTLFLREHNRICDELIASTPGWDDERLFQTARMINIVLLMKIVIEEYINHIAGAAIFSLNPGFGVDKPWYRTNWIALEFNLLYRWHSLVPDYINAGEVAIDVENDIRNNNELLETWGLARAFQTFSMVPAGKIALYNVPKFLWGAENAALRMSRGFRLKSYNDYRAAFNLGRLRDFDELTRDPRTQADLRRVYTTIDRVEFIPGLFAEDADHTALFGDLLNTMVAYDAFTQIYTNPLLAPEIYNENTFTAYGFELFNKTNSILDIAKRNVASIYRAQFDFAA